MKVFRDPFLTIYIGDATDQFFPDTYKQNPSDEKFKRVIDVTEVRPIFLHQVHESAGEVITAERASKWRPFEKEGDYLITNVPEVGLGVVTADCLPVVMYDRVNRAIGIAHAGWHGAVAGVVQEMFEHMKQEFGSNPASIQVWLGPCMKSCCYEVQKDLVRELPQERVNQVITNRADQLFFDLPQLVMMQLGKIGISPASIDLSYHECTHCNQRFYSHRRDQEAGRNMTVVSLK